METQEENFAIPEILKTMNDKVTNYQSLWEQNQTRLKRELEEQIDSFKLPENENDRAKVSCYLTMITKCEADLKSEFGFETKRKTESLTNCVQSLKRKADTRPETSPKKRKV